MEVAICYKKSQDLYLAEGGIFPQVKNLARECKVSEGFVRRLIEEMETERHIMNAKETSQQNELDEYGPTPL